MYVIYIYIYIHMLLVQYMYSALNRLPPRLAMLVSRHVGISSRYAVLLSTVIVNALASHLL